jgi:hypothetical protein
LFTHACPLLAAEPCFVILWLLAYLNSTDVQHSYLSLRYTQMQFAVLQNMVLNRNYSYIFIQHSSRNAAECFTENTLTVQRCVKPQFYGIGAGEK